MYGAKSSLTLVARYCVIPSRNALSYFYRNYLF